MMIQGVSINEMISQSMTVLTKPAVATFEQFERRGGQREGMTYVATAAAIGAVVSLLVGVFTLGVVGGIVSAIFSAIIPVAMYFIGSTIIHAVGTSQGGTGTKDEVFYSIALFQAPILAINGVIGSIPLLNCLALPATIALGLYSVYLGYLAIRGSMNLDSNKAIITMVVAWIVQLIIGAVLGAILGIAMAAVGVVPATPTIDIPTS